MRTAAVLAILGLFSATVWAEPPGLTPPDPPLVDSYRAQTLAADGIALLGFALAFKANDGHTQGTLLTLAVGTYLLGAPVIHLEHHRPGQAIGSLVMRAGVPALTTLLIMATYKDPCPPEPERCDDYSELGWLALGLIGSGLAASAVDSGVLAKGDEPPRRWQPTLAATRGGMTVGLGGSF